MLCHYFLFSRFNVWDMKVSDLLPGRRRISVSGPTDRVIRAFPVITRLDTGRTGIREEACLHVPVSGR